MLYVSTGNQSLVQHKVKTLLQACFLFSGNGEIKWKLFK